MPRWVKGQSGNPSGKAKGHPILRRTITEMARDAAPAAIETLITVMKSSKSTMTARAIAADRILDRAFGKAPQAIGLVAAPNRPVEQLSDAELHAIIASAQRDADGTKLIEGEAIKEGESAAPRPLDVDTNVGTAESDGYKPK
jgi:hypothetical protein